MFGRRWPQATLIGFLVSLGFETCQLTGVFWIYPGPFRLFDTGDLVLKTRSAA
jgi:ADP-dependent NAD(P)H-hydrate dehydratase / NAD(P)H-hydrate epimerase